MRTKVVLVRRLTWRLIITGMGSAARRKSVAQFVELLNRPMAENVLLEKQWDVARMENVQAARTGQHWKISVPEHASMKQMRNTEVC